jgi:lysophospholipase L1-like esterase
VTVDASPAAPAVPARLRPGPARALLPLAAAFATLLALEIGLRARAAWREAGRAAAERRHMVATMLLHRLSDDPVLIYELRRGVTVERDGTVYRINAHGLRDDRELPPKGPGERRVLVLGDSVAFGLGVEGPRTFPALLEAALDRQRPPTRVLNLSVLGYRTAQEVRLFERDGWALEPDAVILAFCLNDFDDYAGDPPPPEPAPAFGLRWQAPRRLGPLELPEPVPWLDRSALFRTATGRLRVDYYRWVASDPGRQEKVWEGFRRLAAGLSARGVPGMVAVFPLLVDGRPHPYADLHAMVARHAAAAGLAVADLAERLPAGALADLRQTPGDVLHLNERGHALAASALAPCAADARLRCPGS